MSEKEDEPSVREIAEKTPLFTEIGGGIRSMDTVRAYLEAGVDRVILGTAAVNDPEFLRAALTEYGERIAVGVDIKDGKVAIKGWLETSDDDAMTFCTKMQAMGVKTIISTDISKDGAMQGANHELYRTMSEQLNIQIVASGGVSSMEDVTTLAATGLYGAIIGKAYYTGAIDLKTAIEVSK
jgi:phosphoribosylformimino-5-aminoimidazole carboxamide ribotide isomerase